MLLLGGSTLCVGLPRVIRTSGGAAVAHVERKATIKLKKTGFISTGAEKRLTTLLI
jgi:hypothetical protein